MGSASQPGRKPKLNPYRNVLQAWIPGQLGDRDQLLETIASHDPVSSQIVSASADWSDLAPALELDREQDFLAFVQSVLDTHMAEMTATGGYAIEKGDEADRVQSVVASTFLSSFGRSPADRFADIFEQAAAFAAYLVRDHPFGDGNKRTAIRIALALIAMRGVELDIDDSPDPGHNALYGWVEDLVSKSLDAEGLAARLRQAGRVVSRRPDQA
ncbi:death-on-curing family protein [Bifidobacterium aemilianum]|uniref:Death-on-curing family protein n=1 Tax=Bifidobacterium aemilianum TaxID=2493120 RepID=A0A366K8U0_9BIFI|nr:type II toxin-antitoxin system death-on-curing family toxin [Bifidobacterium aemilianum]RBP98160.1 death-on-curing family protein [Bifidobacterium aemilianum]